MRKLPITDISALSRVHVLPSHGCDIAVDIIALGNVHNINFRCCMRKVDLRTRGRVYVMNRCGCTSRAVDVNLGNEHNFNFIYLENERRFRNVSKISRSQIFGLYGCYDEFHASVRSRSLNNVHNLIFSDCSSTVDVTSLDRVRILNLCSCIRRTDQEALRKFDFDYIYCKLMYSDDGPLDRVHVLKLQGCDREIDVRNEGNAQKIL